MTQRKAPRGVRADATPEKVVRDKYGSSGDNGNQGTGLSGSSSGSLNEEFNWQSVRPEWSTWKNYPKEIRLKDNGDTQQYAKIAGRYYSHHAVQGMNWRSLGYSAGDPHVAFQSKNGLNQHGHSVSPRVVENILRYGDVLGLGESPGTTRFQSADVVVTATHDKKVVVGISVEKSD